MLDWVPSQPTVISLDTIFDALTDSMYDLYVYLNNVYISVAGYRFTLWNFVIGAMLIAVVTAACIPDTPGCSVRLAAESVQRRQRRPDLFSGGGIVPE